ncbi:MAG: hypothetical protein ACFFFY_09390 [Promethearchaeota archaeon]
MSKFKGYSLLLAIRIDIPFKGYVDFYFVPKKLRQIVDIEAPTFKKTNYMLSELGMVL